MNEPISDLQVERLALGELPADVAKRVRATLEASGDPRLAAIERSNAEILAAHPPKVIARRIAARLEALEPRASERSPAWWMWMPIAVALAAAVLVWIVRPREPASELGAAPVVAVNDTVRLKGDAALVVHRQTGSLAEPLTDRASVRSGETLQLGYRAGTASHGAIVSIDGAGAVTLHFPSEAGDPTELRTGGLVPLDHAYRLDDAPVFERFVFVTATVPVDVAAILAAAERVAAGADPAHAELGLPAGFEQRSLLVHKP